MIGKLRIFIIVLAVALVLTFVGTAAGAVGVELYPEGACTNTGGSSDMCKKGGDDDLAPTIEGIVNVILYAAGAIAIFFILLGGFKFITSAGDASKAASARNTVLYAVIGLVVVALSYAIADIVVKRIIT